MTEELHDARHEAPRAIMWSVWIGAVTGFVFLIAAMFCIGDLQTVANTTTGVPLIAIFQEATGSVGGALGLTILVTVIALVSLVFLMAQSSRVVFSFARDHGLPFSRFISRVHPTLHVPIYSISLVLVINMALMSIYFGTVEGFNTVLAISTEAFCKTRRQFMRSGHLKKLSADIEFLRPLLRYAAARANSESLPRRARHRQCIFAG